jgi:hypothetical protein
VAALARLGAWPDQADELPAWALLPPHTAAILRAVHLVRSGHQDEGLAQLRDIATRTVLAATGLAGLTAEDPGIDAAITERQRIRIPFQTRQIGQIGDWPHLAGLYTMLFG